MWGDGKGGIKKKGKERKGKEKRRTARIMGCGKAKAREGKGRN